jgi:hypothetical protein
MGAKYRYEVGVYICQGLWDDDGEKIDEDNYTSERFFLGSERVAQMIYDEVLRRLQ